MTENIQLYPSHEINKGLWYEWADNSYPYFNLLLWSRGGLNDDTTRKWVIRNLLKENSTFMNDSWEKPLLSLTQSWILHPYLVTAHRDCAEENLTGICHMRVSPSIRVTPQHIHIFTLRVSWEWKTRRSTHRKWTSISTCSWHADVPRALLERLLYQG